MYSEMSVRRMKSIQSEPTEINFHNMRFLITDSPTDDTIKEYSEALKKYDVTDVVRVCEPTYSAQKVIKNDIRVLDLPFIDGSSPTESIVYRWFLLLRTRFKEDPGCRIAVHCIAGLGRAPVLVALALIEAGLKYEDAVEMIRKKRRGACNAKQISYLSGYRPKSRLKQKPKQKRCVIQ